VTSLRLLDSDTDLLQSAIRENALALEAAAEHLTRLIVDGAPAELIEAHAITVREHCHDGRLLRQYLKAELAG
jgi:hypothetical protein